MLSNRKSSLTSLVSVTHPSSTSARARICVSKLCLCHVFSSPPSANRRPTPSTSSLGQPCRRSSFFGTRSTPFAPFLRAWYHSIRMRRYRSPRRLLTSFAATSFSMRWATKRLLQVISSPFLMVSIHSFTCTLRNVCRPTRDSSVHTSSAFWAERLGGGIGFERLISACISSRVGISAVVDAMLSTTALARGSSFVLLFWDEDLDAAFEGEMAFSVRARMALRDFLVPKVRPRVERAERVCWCSATCFYCM